MISPPWGIPTQQQASTYWTPGIVPASPNASDDEFTGDLSGWTTIGTWGTNVIDPYTSFSTGGMRYSVNSRRPSWLMCQPPGDSTAYYIHKAITVGTNFYAYWRFSFNTRLASAANNDCNMGMVVGASTGSAPDFNNEIVLYFNEGDASAVQAQFDKIVAGATTAVSTSTNRFARLPNMEYGGLQKVGTTWYAWVGNQAGVWNCIGTTTFAVACTRAHIFFSNVTAGTPGPCIMGVDFFRIGSGTVFPV